MKILVLNCGSSSVKYQVIDGITEQVDVTGLVERIGEAQSRITHKDATREVTKDCHAPHHEAAIQLMHEYLESAGIGGEIRAIGHRVVHGGERFISSVLIDDEVEAAIQECAALAPLHNPPNLVGIHAARKLFPGLAHVAVFDTAFHQTMPAVAWCYALPWEMYKKHGVRRYGFHGTSHRYVMQRAAQLLRIPVPEFTCITLHLGNGCSAAAIQNGRSVDTSMGMTPLEGLVMGTRCGDIDPAIHFHLAAREGLSMQQLDEMMNKASGLKGISGLSNDVRELMRAASEGHERARLALDVYARRVRKYIGAYLAVLHRPQAIIFTGGVGERGAIMRRLISQGLDHLGLILDPARNEALEGEGDVSAPHSPLRIMVIPTREEMMIARETVEVAGLGEESKQ
jgi:acetate kinase